MTALACMLFASPGQAFDGDPAASSSQISESRLRVRNTAIIGSAGVGMFWYGMNKWWNEGFTGELKTANEGWFGKGTYAGGADKLGHAYSAYVGTRGLTRALEWAGNDEASALKMSTWSVLGALTAMEILDGYSRQWRFSREDVAMNLAGAGFAVLMEKCPSLDRAIDFRLLYWPSGEGGSRFSPFGDYSGQRYLLVGKATAMPELRNDPLLRYFEIAVGYGARGFSDGPQFRPGRSRGVYFGISINLSEVLSKTIFLETPPSAWERRVSETFLEVVQVPGTAGLVRHAF